MTQQYLDLASTDKLIDSRDKLNKNIEAAATLFSGSTFPTANLKVGMPCYRTDSGKLYVLKDLTPTWVMVFDGKVVQEGWGKISDLAATGSDLNTLTASGWHHQPANAGATAGLNYPVAMAGMLQVFAASQMVYQFYTQYSTGTPHTYVRTYYSTAWGAWTRLLTTLDEGPGKGLDADTVDGYQTATTAAASTIPVRDGNGKLPGDITGNAATANTATAVPWTGVTGKPSTLAGYGITDLSWSAMSGTPTSVAGYGITDAVVQGGALTAPLASASGTAADILVGVNATYNYGAVHDAAGLYNVSRYTKAGAWNATMFTVDSAGNFVATGNVTAYSDARLKDELQVIGDALAKVCALTGYTYLRRDSGSRETGLLAQDVQKILPEAVHVGVNEDETLSLAYGNMMGLMVEAVKELTGRVAKLEQKST